MPPPENSAPPLVPTVETGPRFELSDIPPFDPWEHAASISFDARDDTLSPQDIAPLLAIMSPGDKNEFLMRGFMQRNWGRIHMEWTSGGVTKRYSGKFDLRRTGSGRLVIIPEGSSEPPQRIKSIAFTIKDPTSIIKENGGSIKIPLEAGGAIRAETLIGLGMIECVKDAERIRPDSSGIISGRFIRTGMPVAIFKPNGKIVDMGALCLFAKSYYTGDDKFLVAANGDHKKVIEEPYTIILCDSPQRLADFLSTRRITDTNAAPESGGSNVCGIQRAMRLFMAMVECAPGFPEKLRALISRQGAAAEREFHGFLSSLTEEHYHLLVRFFKFLSRPDIFANVKAGVLAACGGEERVLTADFFADNEILARLKELLAFAEQWRPDGKRTMYQCLPGWTKKVAGAVCRSNCPECAPA